MVFAKIRGPRRTGFRVAALVGVLALAATGCVESTNEGRTNDGVPLIDAGKLTTCTHLDYAPFQFHEKGKIVGFDVDLVDLIAKDMGVRQQIVDTPFEGIQSGESLSTRQCDVAAAAISINPVREQNLDFSEPYFDATQALMVRKGSDINSLEDLRGKELGAQLSTTGEIFARQNAETHGYDVIQFEDLPLSVTAVQTKQIDAAINDNSVLADFIKDNPEVKISAEFETGDQYGIGVASDKDELRKRVNEALHRIKSSGEYDRIYQKWFGEQPG